MAKLNALAVRVSGHTCSQGFGGGRLGVSSIILRVVFAIVSASKSGRVQLGIGSCVELTCSSGIGARSL